MVDRPGQALGQPDRQIREGNGWCALSDLHLRRVSLPVILQYWPDMLRVAGSLTTGQVRAYDLIRMMTADGRTTGLGHAFAHYGRIFKTLHLLQLIHVEEYRRMIGCQLNIGESRHNLGRRVHFGNLGQLCRGYERGIEDQRGALDWGQRHHLVELALCGRGGERAGGLRRVHVAGDPGPPDTAGIRAHQFSLVLPVSPP